MGRKPVKRGRKRQEKDEEGERGSVRQEEDREETGGEGGGGE